MIDQDARYSRLDDAVVAPLHFVWYVRAQNVMFFVYLNGVAIFVSSPTRGTRNGTLALTDIDR